MSDKKIKYAQSTKEYELMLKKQRYDSRIQDAYVELGKLFREIMKKSKCESGEKKTTKITISNENCFDAVCIDTGIDIMEAERGNL